MVTKTPVHRLQTTTGITIDPITRSRLQRIANYYALGSRSAAVRFLAGKEAEALGIRENSSQNSS